MLKRSLSILLTLLLIIVANPVLTAAESITMNGLNQNTGSADGESPTLSVTLNNLNQITEIIGGPGQSPTLSMTLNNLNQVTGSNSGLSPTLSMTLNNLNQVTGNNTIMSPTLSMALNSLNRFTAMEQYGGTLMSLFTIKAQLTKDAKAAFNAIAEYVDRGQAAIGYFGMDITDLVRNGKLSSKYLGSDFSKLILSEYVSLGIHNELESWFDVSTTFGFASKYQEGQTVVAIFGYRDRNGNIVWNALNTVAVDGQVRIDFPSELLFRAGSEAILGILS